jgi:hypothetical protein
MQQMAAAEVRAHRTPPPEAVAPEVAPFPAVLGRGLLAGLALGALLGWGLAELLARGVIAVPGWEGLYSQGPLTFRVLGIVLGAALGGMLLGIAAILRAEV